MSDNVNTTTVGIDSENDFIAQVKQTGVLVPEVGMVYTEGEGRATRYFIDDERVKKADVEALFEEGSDWEVPVEGDHEHGEIQCRYCGAFVGYLTGSHMKSHDEGPQTVDEYRQFVAEKDDIDPSDVPLAPDELNNVFHQAGDLDEETRKKLSEMNKQRWESGEYDHLRKEDEDEEDDDEEDEEGNGEAEPVEAAQ